MALLPGETKRVYRVIAQTGHENSSKVQLQYANMNIVGTGSFGIVYKSNLANNNETVAIKKVLQEKRYKNRELEILRNLDHVNIVKLKYFFYSTEDEREETFLNLVMEYLPENLYNDIKRYRKARQTMPIVTTKVYMFQLMRGLSFIHSKGLCHRDVKPQNLLVDPTTAVLKICDFGSSKYLMSGESNNSYMCTRYYRAPELIFGAVTYTATIDVWSSGCVFVECLLGRPLFAGDSAIDQLVEIIKVLGRPSKEQLKEMNPNYTDIQLPLVKPMSLPRAIPTEYADAAEIITKMLDYSPNARPSPMQICAHNTFTEIRQQECRLPNGNALPLLFNFTQYELALNRALINHIIPAYQRDPQTGGRLLEKLQVTVTTPKPHVPIEQVESWPPGYYLKLDFEEGPVYVNIIEETFPPNSRLKKKRLPSAAACYSHSPPDMPLEEYNRKRHDQMFRKDMNRLVQNLQTIANERNKPGFEFKPVDSGQSKSSKKSSRGQ